MRSLFMTIKSKVVAVAWTTTQKIISKLIQKLHAPTRVLKEFVAALCLSCLNPLGQATLAPMILIWPVLKMKSFLWTLAKVMMIRRKI